MYKTHTFLISDIMDPPFWPSHIDGGAIHLHCRCLDKIWIGFDNHEIADSRYQSIYNPTTDEWILQVTTTTLYQQTNHELIKSQKFLVITKRTKHKSQCLRIGNFDWKYFHQIKYLQKRDSGMYECQVHKSHHPSSAAQNCQFVVLDKYFEYTRVGLDLKPRFLSKVWPVKPKKHNS